MAARMKKPTEGMRKISKPIISSDIMGNRNVEVRAVGAWVKAEHQTAGPEAVMAAEEEQYRLRQIQLEKQERLQHFQQEVKRRVKQLDRLKKKQNLETNYKASEHERNIVCQSAFASEDIHNRKDSCLVRPMTALTIKQTNLQDGYMSDPEDVKRQQAFFAQTDQVHQHVKHARRNLVSHRVVTENFVPDNLPGGVWKVSSTRDHPASRYTIESNVLELDDDEDIDELKVKVIKAGSDLENDKENQDERTTGKAVHFDLKPQKEDTRRDRRDKRPATSAAHGTEGNRAVPNIYAGVQSEEEKRRARSQQAMYRRLFMDIEREQVKENLRRQEHRKRIQRIKKEKEEARLKEEQLSQQLIEPRDPVTGETSFEILQREAEEQRFISRTIHEHERKIRKNKEMERYIEALRQQLKEKIRRKGLELPPLCCCGDSLWDTNPETCANNCIFYKNPKEYARALQAMLNSNEVLK